MQSWARNCICKRHGGRSMKTTKLKFLTSRTLLSRTGDRGNLVSHKYLPFALLPASFHNSSLCPFCPLPLPSKWRQALIVYLVFAIKRLLGVSLQDGQEKPASWEFYFHARSVSVLLWGIHLAPKFGDFWRALSERFMRLWNKLKVEKLPHEASFLVVCPSYKSKPFKMEREGGGEWERELLLKVFVRLRFWCSLVGDEKDLY